MSLAEGVKVDFGLIGRYQATTFAGLCANHDSVIFSSIERGDVSITDARALFLLAYRAVYRELHATMDAAVKQQGAYLTRATAGLEPRDESSPTGRAAVGRMIVSYEPRQSLISV
ncbi:MAG: hypothetical protein DMF76_14940 [Acidobacteria bacterium]|nr:MAG: hypothetical protein DMF76_14940 [Acidobacteriota bacterium]